MADVVVLQSPKMFAVVALDDEFLEVLQGKEKQHKVVKLCVGFPQLTCRQKGTFCQQQQSKQSTGIYKARNEIVY